MRSDPIANAAQATLRAAQFDEALALPEADAEIPAFYRRWLTAFCEHSTHVKAALLIVRQGSDSTYHIAASWPDTGVDIARLAELCRHAVEQAQQIAVDYTVPSQHGGVRDKLVAQPIAGTGGALPVAAVAMHLSCDHPGEVAGEARRLSCSAGWIAAADFRAAATRAGANEARYLALLDLLALAGEHDYLDESALVVANELAARLTCTRVSIGLRHGEGVRLRVVSHSSAFDRRSQLIETIENAMQETLYQRRILAVPEAVEGDMGVVLAHRELLRHSGGGAIASVPLRGRSHLIGVLVAERSTQTAFLPAERALLDALGAALGPVLEIQQEREHWLAGRPARLWRALHTTLGQDRPMARVYAGLAAVVAALLLFVPVRFEITEKSVLEGQVQRVLVVPFDGFVSEAPGRAGDIVRAGDVLVRLDDRDLLLDQAHWLGEVQTLSAKYADALAQHDRSNLMIFDAQRREAQAQLDLARSKLAKTRIVAPVDGVVVSGDLSQSLGSPVERGKMLFEVAPLDRFRVVVQVDERDMRFIRIGQRGQIVLSALPATAVPLIVSRTTPIATAEGGRNYFRVEAMLQRRDARLRPGMEGVARLDAGRRPLLWAWTRTLVDWLRVFFWKWLP